MSTISMGALARFADLEGAAELIDAYSRIPPGPLRTNLVQQAQIIAAQYDGTPYSPPDPNVRQVRTKPGGKPAQAALPAPTRTGRKAPTGDPTTEAVRLRIEHPEMKTKEIAEATGLSQQQVYQAIYEARKAGAPIPKTRNVGPLTGKGSASHNKWHTDFDSLSAQGQVQVTKAAAARGIEPQAYLDRRVLALKLAQEGASYDRILADTKETDSKIVSAWLSVARGAGLRVPYVTFLQQPKDAPAPPQADPEPEPDPEPVTPPQAPAGRVFPSVKDMHQGAAVAVHKAAQRRAMSVADYEEMREAIVRHRMAGLSPAQISSVTGQGKQFVKDTLDAGVARGVVYPALDEDGGAVPYERQRVTA